MKNIIKKICKPIQWQHLGNISSNIAGYKYQKRVAKFGEKVIFILEPDNKSDPLAIAIYNQQHQQLGYLPRRDAAIFSSVIKDGSVKLAATVGQLDNPYISPKISLQLSVYLRKRHQERWFKKSKKDDYQNSWHNKLLNIWDNTANCSLNELMTFSDDIELPIRRKSLYDKTAILYRIIKEKIKQRHKSEKDLLRKNITKSFKHFYFGNPFGSAKLTVLPIFPDKNTAKQFKAPETLPAELLLSPENLLNYYAYPTGANGAVYHSHGEFQQLYYASTPARMEINWFRLLTDIEPYSGAHIFPDTLLRQLAYLRKLIKSHKFDFHRGDEEIIMQSRFEGSIDMRAIFKGNKIIELKIIGEAVIID
ncbi:MAG: HIRAN domain-containing protein [Victivallaceae bacterium]|nr:HIRAN domain-containing protein [Victivallaceae bacterium]